MLAPFLIACIRLYKRVFSPVLQALGAACRFEPSCSRYAVLCLERHGALRGSLLSVVRLCKCHPFHPGGYDPPPGHPSPTSTEGVPRERAAPPNLYEHLRDGNGEPGAS